MALTVYHVWTCDICCDSTTDRHRQECQLGNRVLHHWPPRHWNYIDGQLVCPRHQLTIGKEEPPKET